jgi:hypothetical protein
MAKSARFAEDVEQRLPAAAVLAHLRDEMYGSPLLQVAPRVGVERGEQSLKFDERVQLGLVLLEPVLEVLKIRVWMPWVPIASLSVHRCAAASRRTKTSPRSNPVRSCR